MMKKIALSGLLCSLLSLPLLAQTPTTAPDAPAHTRMGKRHADGPRPKADAATRARKMTDRLTKELSLDAATAQKVYDATLTRNQKLESLWAKSDDRKANMEAMKATSADYKAQLKGILTADQYAKLETLKKDHQRGKKGDWKGRPKTSPSQG